MRYVFNQSRLLGHTMLMAVNYKLAWASSPCSLPEVLKC